MLKITDNLPVNVLAIEAEGEVTGADYENVLIPAVDKKLMANKKCVCSVPWGPTLRDSVQRLC